MSKVVPLSAIAELVPSGASIGLGGAWMSNHPMAAVREIVRRGIGGLRVFGSLSSLDVDLLVGAGLVRELTFSMISLEVHGFARHFRDAVEQGKLKTREMSGIAYAIALDAGARNVPFLPAHQPGRSQLPELPNDAYAQIRCPFTGQDLLAVRAIVPDVAIVHVSRADGSGNCQVDGPLSGDPELVRAARRVVVTCEEVVDSEAIAADPASTTIPGFLVDAVIHAPFGAHPTSHVPTYGADAWDIASYANACKDGRGKAWIERLIDQSEDSYRDLVLDDERRAVLTAIGAGALSRNLTP
jgi:glutaconate CoA-transferase subunit A